MPKIAWPASLSPSSPNCFLSFECQCEKKSFLRRGEGEEEKDEEEQEKERKRQQHLGKKSRRGKKKRELSEDLRNNNLTYYNSSFGETKEGRP